MSIFRKKRREVPGLNTASLPDLIFTVLFFFMIVTHMSSRDEGVEVTMPQGKELTELKKSPTVYYIYVGRQIGTDSIVYRMNGETMTLDDIERYMKTERTGMTADELRQTTVSITADRNVSMGIITDLKNAIKSPVPIKINYAATEE